MEATVSGKRVVLRDDIPARAGFALMRQITKAKAAGSKDVDAEAMFALMEFDDLASLCAAMVIEWEFDGSPKKVETYGDMGLTTFLELLNHVMEPFNKASAAEEESKN